MRLNLFRWMLSGALLLGVSTSEWGFAESLTNAPVSPGTTAPNPTVATTNVPTPGISRIIPGAPLNVPIQTLILIGSNFQDTAAVSFSDAEGNSLPAYDVKTVDSGRLILTATLAAPGSWKATAKNSGGAVSASFPFQVANGPAPGYCWRIKAFFTAVGIVTVLMAILFIFMLSDLSKAQKEKQWSLGNALSEESEYQPAVIRQKSDVIMFASTSRLIALLGLLGILTIVIGIGYAIMWNLFIYGTVPDLSEVRSFLYGSACLFAPYLANKLSGVFDPSGKSKIDATPAQTAITGIGPASPTAATNKQLIHITGMGFKPGLVVTLTDPQGGLQKVDSSDITAVADTVISANVTLAIPGGWNITVQNPPTEASQSFIFTVAGPPTISGIKGGSPQKANATEQEWTFTGTGFMSGISVTLTGQDASGAAVSATVTAVTAVSSTTVTVKAILNVAGDWKAIAMNPPNFASPAFAFKIN